MSHRFAQRRGVTLLELILALGLSVIVLGAIAWALQLYLRAFDTRRTDIEKAQLARAVLKLIADDLRSVVAHNAIDFTDAAKLATAASVPGLDEALGGDDSGGGDDLVGGISGDDIPTGDTPTDGAEEEPKDLSSDLMPSTIPGIYGNQYQLQMDISRLPRIEDFVAGPGRGDIPSDVKTVAYYLAPETTPTDDNESTLLADRQAAQAASAAASQGWGRGLVRRALDRSVTEWAVNNGDLSLLDAQGELVAEEVVALEFRYFDGSSWLMEWDTQSNGGLPQAIEVAVAIDTRDAVDIAASGSRAPQTTELDPLALQSGDDIKVFSQIIRIPAAAPIDPNQTLDDEVIETDAP
jgi:hypothetical protein